MNLKKNIGKLDKFIRVPVGIILIIGGIYFNSFWGLVGVIPLVSGLSGLCPLYAVFGISTNKAERVKSEINIINRGKCDER